MAQAPRKNPKTGLWEFTFTSVHRKPDGSRRQVHRRNFTREKDAKTEMQRLMSEDKQSLGSTDDNLTVNAVFDDFVRTKRLAGRAPNTIAQYEWAAALAAGRWGGWPAEELTAELLDETYLQMLRSGRRVYRSGKGTTTTDNPMKPRTIEAFHKALKAAFQLAVNKGKLRRNPAALATAPSVIEQTRRFWTPEQVGQFLDCLVEHPCICTGLGEVLADTGGRRGEALGLRWEDIDLEAGSAAVVQNIVVNPEDHKNLLIRRPKRQRSKSIINLHPDTVTALRRRRAEQAQDRLRMGSGWPKLDTVHHGLVFTWPDGTAIHPEVLTRTVGRMSKAAGLPYLTPHGLRHSWATGALKAKVPVEVVAARLGNTTRVVQEIYQHVIPADDQAAAQLVGDLYRRRPEAK